MDAYVIVDGGMRNLATGEIVTAEPPVEGAGLGSAALGTSPLGA